MTPEQLDGPDGDHYDELGRFFIWVERGAPMEANTWAFFYGLEEAWNTRSHAFFIIPDSTQAEAVH